MPCIVAGKDLVTTESIAGFPKTADFLGIGAVVAVLLLTLIYLLSKIFKGRKLSAFFTLELYDLTTTMFLVGLIFIGYSFLSSNTSSQLIKAMFNIPTIDDSVCLFQNIEETLIKNGERMVKVYKALIWGASHYEMVGNVVVSRPVGGWWNLILSFGVQESYSPFYDALITGNYVKGLANWVQMAINANYLNLILYALFVHENIGSLLALALVLRLFPFTKNIANILLAVIVSFALVYPIALLIENAIFSLNDDDISRMETAITEFRSELEDMKLVQPSWTSYFTGGFPYEIESNDGGSLKYNDKKLFDINVAREFALRVIIMNTLVLMLNLLIVISALKGFMFLFRETDTIIDFFVVNLA